MTFEIVLIADSAAVALLGAIASVAADWIAPAAAAAAEITKHWWRCSAMSRSSSAAGASALMTVE